MAPFRAARRLRASGLKAAAFVHPESKVAQAAPAAILATKSPAPVAAAAKTPNRFFQGSPQIMPFYEYECENCKFYIELLQKVSDAPLKKCPSCGKSAMKKLVSAPVFRLKGSGWYETDFKGDKENKRNLAVEKEAESSSSEDAAPAKAAADAKAGDAKPAAAEAKPVEAKEASGRSSGGASRKVAARSGTPAKSSRTPAKPATKAKPKAKAKAAARGRRR
jgi:putative FmdB family regulatory protein